MDANVALGRRLNADMLAFVLYALLLDIAIETFWSGSPVRWWVVAVAVVYLALCGFIRWREAKVPEKLRPVAGPTASLLVILGLLAVTAWLPAGLTEGVRVLRQPTAVVLATLVAAGVALSAIALATWNTLPRGVRIGFGVIAAYGVLAFAGGAITGTSLPALLAGRSVWERLPMVLQGAFIGGLIILPIGLIAMVVRAGLRRTSEASLQTEISKGAAMAASLAIVLAGMPLRSGGSRQSTPTENVATTLGIDPNTPKLSPAALNAALANSFKAIEDGERDAARDRWDPAYVAADLGSDPQRIFSWIQGNTFLIPYRGLLRGPTGVLMDRVGNSFDRAALLAVVLRQANRTVRLAHGSLSQGQASDVLRGSSIARYGSPALVMEPPVGDMAAVARQYELDPALIGRTLSAQLDSRTQKRTLLLQRIPDQTQRLVKAIGQQPRAPVESAANRVIEALQDHWWVQSLESGGWQDLDLLSPSPGVALTDVRETIELDNIPQELRHQIVVRVIAERWADGAITEQTALEHALLPSQHIGKPIVLRFAPEKPLKNFTSPNTTPEAGLRAAALEQHEWTPVLVIGRDPVARWVIRETGELAEGKPATPSPADAMTSLSKRFEDALGPSVPAEPTHKPERAGILTSVSLEYEVRVPGETPRKIRRMVFDLIGPAARAARPLAAPQLDEADRLARSLALMMETDVLPVVCRFAPEFVTHLGAQSVLANRELLSAVVRGDFTDDFSAAQQVSDKLVPIPTPLYALAVARFEWSRFDREIYIDRPNILTMHRFIAPASPGFKLVRATDIVANEIGVDVTAENPFAIRLEQGVLDTNAETILASNSADALNTATAFTNSADWLMLTAPRDRQIERLQHSNDVRQRIADDLAAGYLVVAPSSPVAAESARFAGWWRIDPATGHTLGMGDTGWGQEFVEYLITAIPAMIIGAGLGFLFEYLLCRIFMSGSAPVARGCDPAISEGHFALADFFVAPLHAAGSECLSSAIVAALLGGLMGGLGGLGGGGSRGGGARGGGGNPPDLGKTAPDLGDTLPQTPFANTQPGAGGGGKPPMPPGGGGNPGPGPGGGGPPEYPPDVQREIAAWNKWKQSDGPDKAKYFNEWINALRESLKAANPDHPYFKDPIPYPEGPWGKPGWSPPGQGGGSPPTGPGGTQIIPPATSPNAPTLPGTGPGGTQIIPPATSPNAPTLPGTGPGGTQIIPPGPTAPTQKIICPGPGCPPSPYEKTQTGLGGVLNALGQSTQP